MKFKDVDWKTVGIAGRSYWEALARAMVVGVCHEQTTMGGDWISNLKSDTMKNVFVDLKLQKTYKYI